MADNVVQAVASGNSPQPAEGQPSNYDGLQNEVENAVDSGLEAQESNEAATANQAAPLTPKQAQDLKKKLKLKVDGQDIDQEIDFNNEEDLRRHLQKSMAFDKRLNEFSKYKNQTDQVLQMLQNDPEALLEKMGFNVDDMAEKRLQKRIEDMKKSPEQLEMEKMRRELEEHKKEKERLEGEKKQADLERMRNEQAQQIETDITGALDDSKSILPKGNPLVMQRIAQTMLLAMQRGYTGVSAKDVIPLVEKQWREELNEMFSVLPEETIEKLVGKTNLDRYRKKRVSASRAQTITANQLVKDSGSKQEVEAKDSAEANSKGRKKFKQIFSIYD